MLQVYRLFDILAYVLNNIVSLKLEIEIEYLSTESNIYTKNLYFNNFTLYSMQLLALFGMKMQCVGVNVCVYFGRDNVVNK